MAPHDLRVRRTLCHKFERLHLLPRTVLQDALKHVFQLLVSQLEVPCELRHCLLVRAEVGALEVCEGDGGAVERSDVVSEITSVGPSANDSLFSIRLLARRPQFLDRFHDPIDVPVRDLELLGAAVDGTNSLLYCLPAGVEPVHARLDLLGERLHFVHVREEDLDLGALLRKRCFAWAHHGCDCL